MNRPRPSPLPPRELDAVIALANAGRSGEAAAGARALLATHPEVGVLWQILGGALHAQGRVAESIPCYERALDIDPRQFEIQNNLGNALLALGRHEEAAACYARALEIKADAEVHSNLGNALRHLGRLDEALENLRRALTLQPALAAAHNNLGVVLAMRGQLDDAAASYRRALALDPAYVDALNNWGAALRDLGDLRQAAACHARAVELDPNRPASHYNLSKMLLDFGRFDEAAACCRRALALQPDYAPALLTLSVVLRQFGRAAEAEASCRAALASQPNSAEALSFLGELCADAGHFGEAEALFRRVLAIDPDFPNAWAGIVNHRRMTQHDAEWLRGAEALAAKPLPLRHAIRLRYALGKYFDDVGQYERAFGHYGLANELTQRYGLPYDRAALTRRVAASIGGFDAPWIRRCAEGVRKTEPRGSERPVFIVGMPRSGTSLAEQILASHPAVFGAGELAFWNRASADYAAGETRGGEGMLARLADAYLAQLASFSRDALRVVDKMPSNVMNLGLIHTAFPNAKIIHMRRHPIDTCLSIYFQPFAHALPYSNDLGDLAHYYQEYRRVMDHWRHVIPATALLEVPYEGLIENQEGWTRRLVDFIGLPWSASCLEFHRTDRVVITASKWQVRQKIHAASAGRWMHYEKFVEPLKCLLQ